MAHFSINEQQSIDPALVNGLCGRPCLSNLIAFALIPLGSQFTYLCKVYRPISFKAME